MGTTSGSTVGFGRSWNSVWSEPSGVLRRSSITLWAVASLGMVAASGPGQPLEIVSPNAEDGAQFGASVSGVADLNGDGRGEVVVGAAWESPGGTMNAGRAYILSGSDGTVVWPLVSPHKQESGYFGISVSAASDVNGDGWEDVVVGAPAEVAGETPGAGRAYIISGSDGTVLWPLVSPNGQDSGQFGFSVSGVPDVNGDGRGDVVVGALYEDPGVSPDISGRAYIFSGSDGTLISTLVLPIWESGTVGARVSGVADVNGDGRGDVVSGGGATMDCVGGAHIFSGSDGTLLHALVPPVVDPTLCFGISVSGVPDVNGDGRGDVVVGAGDFNFMDDFTPGKAYIFSGSDGTVLTPLSQPGYVPEGDFGGAVTGIPDVNGDGRGDAIVGGRFSFAACVFSGLDGTVLDTLLSPDQVNLTMFGFSSSGIPDVNGDGGVDFAVGAAMESGGGRAYIFFGPAGIPTPTPTPINQEPNGHIFYAPGAGGAPLTVELSGVGYDPDGEVVRCSWYFEDWQHADASWETFSAFVTSSTTHVYDSPGIYQAAFGFKDNHGAMGQARGEVVVWTSTPAPTVTGTPLPSATPTPIDTPRPWEHCDVNGDGKVDHLDVIEIQRWWQEPDQ